MDDTKKKRSFPPDAQSKGGQIGGRMHAINKTTGCDPEVRSKGVKIVSNHTHVCRIMFRWHFDN